MNIPESTEFLYLQSLRAIFEGFRKFIIVGNILLRPLGYFDGFRGLASVSNTNPRALHPHPTFYRSQLLPCICLYRYWKMTNTYAKTKWTDCEIIAVIRWNKSGVGVFSRNKILSHSPFTAGLVRPPLRQDLVMSCRGVEGKVRC